MKFYIKNTDIVTDKPVSDSRIVAIADLHYTKSLGKNFLNALTEKIKSLSPKYICFLGDLVEDESTDVIDWLNDLSKISLVLFTYGNHDISRYIPEKNQIEKTFLTEDKLNDIKNIDSLKVLEAGQTFFVDNFSFLGLPYYDIDEFNDYVNKINRYDTQLDSDFFNSMLVHNPWIMKEKNFRKLNSTYYYTDLIMSGHTHNGLVPHKIDEHLKGNKGLFAPSQGILPELTRGNIDVDSTYYSYKGIIVPALRTIPQEVPANKSINKTIYPPAIEVVRVLKK